MEQPNEGFSFRRDGKGVSVLFRPEVRKRVEQIAQRKGTSSAAVIRWAVDDYLNKQPEQAQ